MEFLVPIVLYGWPPAVILIFRELRGHRAIAFAYVAAWLFLPSAQFPIRGLPDYDKMMATSMGILLAAGLIEPHRLFSLRPRWFDLPMVVFCLSPLPSTFTNGLGLWHGVSMSLGHLWAFGIPYYLGRVYFDSFRALLTLAKAILIGGLVYVPLCLIEIRMSPQLYLWVYGFRPRRFNAARYGGWRPNVFLEEGLELGMWMTVASLLGIWLWYSGAWKKSWGIAAGPLLCVLLGTTVLCRSTGALLLLIMGCGTLGLMRITRSPWPAMALLLIPPVYIGLRASGAYDGHHVVELAGTLINEDRAKSLQFRFDNEDRVAQRAREAIVCGWGGFGRGHAHDEYGNLQSVLDGYWLITFTYLGLVGLISLYLSFLLAPAVACFRFSGKKWPFQEVAPVQVLAVCLVLFAVDTLLNAMLNAIYPLVLGGIATLSFLPAHKLVEHSDQEAIEPPSSPVGGRRLWPPPRQAAALPPPTELVTTP